MAVYKRGRTYYYEFELYGQRYKKSTRCKNERDAQAIEAKARLEIINSKAGIKTQRSVAPTLTEYAEQFIDWVNRDRERIGSRQFYASCMTRILECSDIANKRLDEIDEPVIEAFKTWALRQTTRGGTRNTTLSKARVNRLLATLKKALRYARDMLKLTEKVPIIKMLQGERSREYVFSDQDLQTWLELCPEPLRSASILARYSGICLSEMIALQKNAVRLLDTPDAGGFYGAMIISRGLKRDCRKRTLKLNREMRDALSKLTQESQCQYVFSSLRDPKKPLAKDVLSGQMQRVKARGAFHADAGLHSLRHTYLTQMGRLTDAFTLQKIAGHNCVTTTMKYVHPQEDAMDLAFNKLYCSRPQIAEVTLTISHIDRLLAGETVSLAIPENVKELRLRSPQESTEVSSHVTRTAVSI